MARHPNPRRIKIHRNYSVDEVARRLDIHKNTVRRWQKYHGLEPVGGTGLTIFRGCVLRAFLEGRRRKSRRPSPPGHMYCMGCRATKKPAGGMADLICMSTTLGNLQGICPDCMAIMNRRVNMARLHLVRGDLEVNLTKHTDA